MFNWFKKKEKTSWYENEGSKEFFNEINISGLEADKFTTYLNSLKFKDLLQEASSYFSKIDKLTTWKYECCVVRIKMFFMIKSEISINDKMVDELVDHYLKGDIEFLEWKN